LRRAAGIVEQAIDAAELCRPQRNQRLHLRFHGDVGLAEDAGSAQLLCQRLALGHAASCNDDFGAFRDERSPRAQARCRSSPP
jgi:hypothetical protein